LTAPQFEKAIDDALADDPPTLVIDLTDVTLLASVGLRLLATASGSFLQQPTSGPASPVGSP
jgi:anti-anti-sigma regulatory factor